ncbi:MAG: hypothetical protein QM736_07320 [Vicinamibacterales bacterium]
MGFVMRRMACAAALATAVALTAASVAAQSPTGAFTRTADGKPNLTGIWQAMNTANWDLQAHEARMGPVVSLAATFGVQPGPGVVEGNEIPYLPDAIKKKQDNGANWMALDPEVKCYMAGIPRATYQPFPFQIVQSPGTIMFSYEFASASRIVRMDTKEKSPAPAWMGWNVGRWEGDTLVIDVTDQMEDTWFDRAGNYHSDALHVVERFTPIDANTLKYEATIEDPKVFSRPWTISMPLYRHREANAQLMEYKCVPFAEELMYGHLRKKTR